MLSAALLLALVAAPPSLSVIEPEVSPPPKIVVSKARFVVDVTDAEGRTQSVETSIVPYRIGTSCYRWVLEVEPRDAVLSVAERFTLPAPARNWGGVDGNHHSDTTLDATRSIAATDVVAPLMTGEITHGWCVAAGDLRGKYRIEVFQAERLLRRFDFTVG